MTVFTQQMIDVVKNFNLISTSGMAFKEGTRLLVQDGNKLTGTGTSMVACGILENPIQADFNVADAIQFYSALSGFVTPTVEVLEHQIVIGEKGNGAKYKLTKASPLVVKSPDAVDFPEEDGNIVFTLSPESLNQIIRGVAVVAAPMLAITAYNGELTCAAINPENETADTFVYPVGSSTENCRFILKVENINRLMKNVAYNVTVSPRGLVRFVSDGPFPLSYYIAVQHEEK